MKKGSILNFDVLYEIFQVLQPNLVVDYAKYLDDDVPDESPWVRYRPTRLPVLFILASVCREWRYIALFHPIWRTLAWHSLVPLTRFKTDGSHSTFFRLFMREPLRVNRISSICLDLRSLRVEASNICELFSAIESNQSVSTLVLICGWQILNDKRLIKLISSRFKNLSVLILRGSYPPPIDILHGISSSLLKQLRVSLTPAKLTHLFIDTYGQNGYSSRSLLKFLQIHGQSIVGIRIRKEHADIIQKLPEHCPSLKILRFCKSST